MSVFSQLIAPPSCRRGLAALAGAVLLLSMAACPAPREPQVPPSPAVPPALDFLGIATLETAPEVEGTPVGGLSALAWDPETGTWLALSDDRSNRAPARFYELELSLEAGRLEAEGVRFTGVTFLQGPGGGTFAAGTVDPEGLALLPGREALLISSEGDAGEGIAPFVGQFRRDGTLVRLFEVPGSFLPARDPRTGRPRGVRDNMALESLTLTPGGSLLVAAEGPLAQDDPAPALGHGGRARILRYDVDTGRPVAQYLYPLDPVPVPPAPADGLAVAGLVELHALGEDELLALERAYVAGRGFFLRLYRVSLAGATDVSGMDPLLPPGGGEAPATARKSLLLDLGTLPLPAGAELFNVEGIALGPELPDGRRLLVLVADDNFAADQHTQFLAFAVDPARLLDAAPPAPRRATVAEVQGAAHVSPLAGRSVAGLEGVVTAVVSPGGSLPAGMERGFWMQDPAGDGDPATSRALFVSTAGTGTRVPSPGDRVRVAGRVLELGRPEALTVTAVTLDPALGATGAGVEVTGTAPSPEPVALGGAPGAGCPPGHRIDDDSLASFDPAADGLDFWEALEGMVLVLADPLVVGPTSRYGDVVVVAEGCAEAPRTVHGGLRIRPGDFNPERLVVGPRRAGDAPALAVGQRFTAPLEGVLDYDFSNYRLLPASWPPASPRPWQPQRASLVRGPEHLTVASFNVENLSAVDGEDKLAAIVETVVEGLGSPDVVALQEVQDDTGPRNDGVVSADATLERLVAAIVAAGGPRYDWRQVDPVDGQDGGQPGGNIRNAYLFDPAGVTFVDRGDPAPLESVAVGREGGAPFVVPSPGRLAPADPAFRRSRKPLVAELRFQGHTLFLVNVHFRSKGGDDPLMGPFQPNRLPSEDQRSAQARLVAELVESLLAVDPSARVVVLGDFNDFPFRPPLARLEAAGLEAPWSRIAPEERYTYVYQGNSQVIDHLLVSPALAAALDGFDVVHRHADLPEDAQPSDHEPLVARFHLPPAP